ncbi:hypothetical protein HQ531_04820 [bacterium]|nr:hypothetical protein [bacterium]
MRHTILIFVISILFWSCEWEPDQVEVDVKTSYRILNIAVGDTAKIDIRGIGFDPLEGIDTSIVKVIERIESDSAHYTFIGKVAGQVDLILRYQLELTPNSGLEPATMYLKLTFSNGVPLGIHVGDSLSVDLLDYFDSMTLATIDSMSVSRSGPNFWVDLDLNSGIIRIEALSPGINDLLLLPYNIEGQQLTPLLFEVSSSIRKVVLAEMFTNSGCVNCPQANGYLDNIYESYSEDLVVLRYHVNWTDPADPMNLYNPTEVWTRVLYYSAFAAPGFVLDGSLVGTLDEADWIGRVGLAAAGATPLYISPVDFIESSDSLFINYKLDTFGENLNSVVCWSTVIEDSIEFLGSNGEDIHMQVMRDMEFTLIPEIDSVITIHHSLKKPDDFGSANPMSLLVFVQSESDKMVLQARQTSLF